MSRRSARQEAPRAGGRPAVEPCRHGASSTWHVHRLSNVQPGGAIRPTHQVPPASGRRHESALQKCEQTYERLNTQLSSAFRARPPRAQDILVWQHHHVPRWTDRGHQGSVTPSRTSYSGPALEYLTTYRAKARSPGLQSIADFNCVRYAIGAKSPCGHRSGVLLPPVRRTPTDRDLRA